MQFNGSRHKHPEELDPAPFQRMDAHFCYSASIQLFPVFNTRFLTLYGPKSIDRPVSQNNRAPND